MPKYDSKYKNINHVSLFEESLREHCNIEYDIDGEEIVKSSIASVLIAFEEYENEFTLS